MLSLVVNAGMKVASIAKNFSTRLIFNDSFNYIVQYQIFTIFTYYKRNPDKTVPCCTLYVGNKESFIYRDLSLSEFINCSWIHYWQRILKPTVKYCFNKEITWETDEWDPFEIEDYGLFYLLLFGTNGKAFDFWV